MFNEILTLAFWDSNIPFGEMRVKSPPPFPLRFALMIISSPASSVRLLEEVQLIGSLISML